MCLCSGRLLVGTFVALFFNLVTLMSVRNKPFAYVSEGTSTRLLPVNPVHPLTVSFHAASLHLVSGPCCKQCF